VLTTHSGVVSRTFTTPGGENAGGRHGPFICRAHFNNKDIQSASHETIKSIKTRCKKRKKDLKTLEKIH